MIRTRIDAGEGSPTIVPSSLPPAPELAPAVTVASPSFAADAVGRDDAAASRRVVTDGARRAGANGALAPPRGSRPAPGPVAFSRLTAAPLPDEARAVTAHRTVVAEAAARGTPVRTTGVVATHWAGAVVSAPTQLVLATPPPTSATPAA